MVRRDDNLNMSQNQAIEHKTNKQARTDKQDCSLRNTWSYSFTLLSISKASAAVLHPHLGAAFEKDEPTGASPEKSHRKAKLRKTQPIEMYI